MEGEDRAQRPPSTHRPLIWMDLFGAVIVNALLRFGNQDDLILDFGFWIGTQIQNAKSKI